VHFNPYGGSAAQVAAGLVNLGQASADELSEFMRGQGMSLARLSPDEAAAVAAWSRRLRPVFTESDPDVRVDLLNTLLAASACEPFISRHDGSPPHLHYGAENAGTVRRIQAYTAGGLAHLVCEDATRVGSCARPDCDQVFVDTSRNGRRRFCSTRCATRVHVAQHRDRRRG
jgi:predicted RNA-binding Zn ribbon-like protein